MTLTPGLRNARDLEQAIKTAFNQMGLSEKVTGPQSKITLTRNSCPKTGNNGSASAEITVTDSIKNTIIFIATWDPDLTDWYPNSVQGISLRLYNKKW